MKVLLTHEVFPPDLRGGGELVTYNAARLMQESGISVRVLTTGDPRVTEYNSIPTDRLPIHRYQMNLAKAEIARQAAEADLIHTCNYHACLPSLKAAHELGKPIVCFFLALFCREWRSMKPIVGRAWEAFERYQVNQPFDRLVFFSNHSRDLAIRMGTNPAKAAVLSPGINQNEFYSGAKQDVVLFTGKFDIRKGVFEILEAARRLPDVRFRLYGWGPAEQRLRRSAPSNVEIETYTQAHTLPAELARARICLFPSKKETFGYAQVQAMASGCAIISSIPMEFAGVSIPPDSPSAIAEAVRRLWHSRAETQEMGERNLELSRRYTWQKFADDLRTIYDDAVREHGR